MKIHKNLKPVNIIKNLVEVIEVRINLRQNDKTELWKFHPETISKQKKNQEPYIT